MTTIKATLFATMATVLAAATPASANPATGTWSGPLATAEDLGRYLYHLDRAIQVVKAAFPHESTKAALEAGDVAAALEISRNLPLEHCEIGWIRDGVVQTNCARIEILYMIASHPAAVHRVDWWSEIQRIDEVAEYKKHDLLTSIAVKQSYGGDFDGAFQTANLHALGNGDKALDSVYALTSIAFVAAEKGLLGRSLEFVREAHRRCNVANWCGRDSEGSWIESAYHSELQRATARIAVSQAENGDSVGALLTIRHSDELVGASSDWRDRAHRAIALEQARKGQFLASAKSVASIEKSKWRVEVELEVKEIFESLS